MSAGDPWRRAAGRVQRLPAHHRAPPITAARARSILRCRPEEVEQLARSGWATGHADDGGPLFDGDEILSLGLHAARGRSLPELGAHLVGRLGRLDVTALTRPRTWHLTLTATVPPCATAAAADIDVADIDVAAVDVADIDRTERVTAWTGWRTRPGGPHVDARGHRRLRLAGTATVAGTLAEVHNRAAREAFDTLLDEFTYQFLPAGAQHDPRLLQQLKVVDCVGAAHVLADWLRPQGLPLDVRHGLLMFPTGSGTHAWLEIVDDDGRRKPLDPTLAMMSPLPAGTPLVRMLRGSSLNVVAPIRDDSGVLVARRCGCCVAVVPFAMTASG